MKRRLGRGRQHADATAAPLDEILGDVRNLRLTLAADLHAAAGATEEGAPDVAADIVAADRREVARFLRLATERLRGLDELAVDAPPPPPPSRRRRRLAVTLPAIPAVGALAVAAAAATGTLPVPGVGTGSHQRPVAAPTAVAPSPADTSFRRFVNVLGSDPSASQVIEAASKLHRQLRRLIAASPADPDRAETVARLLELEQSLLLQERPPGAKVVLDATRKLAAKLIDTAPTVTPTLAPTTLPTFDSTYHQRHHPSTTSSPTESSKPSPSPSHSSSAAPHPSESPQPSPSDSSAPGYPPFPALP